MKKRTRRRKKGRKRAGQASMPFTAVFLLIPVVMAWRALWLGSVSLALGTIPVLFLLISLLPACRRRQNQWLLVLTFLCALPVNWLMMSRYTGWTQLLTDGENNIVLHYLVRAVYDLFLTGVEEVVFGIAGRILWHRQYAYRISTR